jgi:hypothetical protein
MGRTLPNDESPHMVHVEEEMENGLLEIRQNPSLRELRAQCFEV